MYGAQRSRDERGLLSRFVLFLGVSGLCGVLAAGLALPAIGAAGLALKKGADGFASLPDALATPPLPQRSRILDTDGKTVATFYAENRISVPLSAIAQPMQQAIVAIEDSRFYDHGGIDVRGTMRAFVSNQTGDSVQGGSTLTQQYVKLVLLEQAIEQGDQEAALLATVRSGKQGYARKLREVRYAIALEKQLSKQQILERYLNIAYFGSGAYGVEAASRHYFSTSASKLTVAQAALLAGIVQSPNAYDPTRSPKAATTRRDVVLQRMYDLGYLDSPEQLAKLKAGKLSLKVAPVPNGCSSSNAPYFCDFVVESIRNDKAFGTTTEDRMRLLLKGGLVIKTTLDPTVQRAAQKAVDANVPRTDKSRIAAAISMVRPGDGAIVAMAQNRSWGTAKNKPGVTTINYNVDRAYGGSSYGFQPGSTFKAFTAASAIKMGIPTTLKVPSPPSKTYADFVACGDPKYHEPDYDVSNSTRGPSMSDMATGLAYSLNTWAVSMEERTGLCAPAEMAESLGLHRGDGKPIQRGPAMALGTTEVAPLSMAEAYAGFAARGQHCESYAIVEVRDRAGKVLPQTRTPCEQVMEPEVADGVNALLAGVIDGPLQGRTGAAMSLGRPAAGKTGTTDANTDVWFVGYTPTMAAAVWVGDPGRPGKNGQTVRKPMQNIVINGSFVANGHGGALAGPIWKSAMRAATKDLPAEKFTSPSTDVTQGARVQVPDVRGMSSDSAMQALTDAGLVGRVSGREVRSTRTSAGDVVYTYPSSGSRVSVGSKVTLYVSNGRAPLPQRARTTPTLPNVPPPPAAGG